MPLDSSPWERLSALPVVIESYEFERRYAEMAYGFQRVTTVIRLLGGGAEGLGEDVSPFGEEDNTLHVARPELPLAGEWTLGELCAHLAGLDQWPLPVEYDVAKRWRNWAFESAALDLALNQAGPPAARGGGPGAAARAVRELAGSGRAADVRPDPPPAGGPPGAALQARRHGRLDAGADGGGGRHRRGRDPRLQGPLRDGDRRRGEAAGHGGARDRHVPGRAAGGRARPAGRDRAAGAAGAPHLL